MWKRKDKPSKKQGKSGAGQGRHEHEELSEEQLKKVSGGVGGSETIVPKGTLPAPGKFAWVV